MRSVFLTNNKYEHLCWMAICWAVREKDNGRMNGMKIILNIYYVYKLNENPDHLGSQSTTEVSIGLTLSLSQAVFLSVSSVGLTNGLLECSGVTASFSSSVGDSVAPETREAIESAGDIADRSPCAFSSRVSSSRVTMVNGRAIP